MTIVKKNIFDAVPSSLPQELTECLLNQQGVRIERIVSRGHASEKGFWYDQEEDEYVLLAQGRARLQFENHDHEIDMVAGDCIHIPAHQRHRVAWTDDAQDTIWFAVFMRGRV